MDLNQIDIWTRQALEAEALRRGIRDPHLRSRADLVRAILRHEFAGPIARGRRRVAQGLHALEQARGLLDAATVVAATLWPTAYSTLRVRRSTPDSDPATDPARRAAVDTDPSGQGDAAGGSRVARGSTPDGARSGLRAAETPAAQAEAPAAESLPDPQALEPDSPEPPVARVRRWGYEPPRTLAVARVLAAQGQRDQALAVYSALTMRNSEDPVPAQEAAIVRAGGDLPWPGRPLPTPAELADSPGSDDDFVACETLDDGGLVVRWQITAAGTERARAVLGEPGETTLRVVVLEPDPQQAVRSHVEEHTPVAASGSRRLEPLARDARRFLAIGVRGQRRFVSIAHAS